MVQINFARKAVTCKVVFYGPARAGKTSNLQFVHDHTPAKVRGTMTSMATDAQRTLFFDFLPLDLGEVAGIRTKVHLYSVPYLDNQNALRLLVLEGADGIVFVADRAPERLEANREALENLRENLGHLGRELEDVPLVFQWNKSDHAEALSLPELESEFNLTGRPSVTATTRTGQGVMTTLKKISGDVLSEVTRLAFGDRKRSVEAQVAPEAETPGSRAVVAVKQSDTGREPAPRSIAAVASIGGAHSSGAHAVAAAARSDEREPVGLPGWRRGADSAAAESSSPLFFGVEPPRLHHEADGGASLPPPIEAPVGRSARDEPAPFSEDGPPTDPEPELHLAPAPTVQPPGWFDEVEQARASGHPDHAPVDEGPRFPLPATSQTEPRGHSEPSRWKPPAPVAHQPVRRPTATRAPRTPVPTAHEPNEAARADHWAQYQPPLPPSRGTHNPRPVVDRRRRPRAVEEQISDRSFWTGAVLSLASLIAIGYVVHAFL